MASEAPPPPPPPLLGIPPGDASRLERLPNELFLQILEYLDSSCVTKLFLVSRHFYKLCLDDRVWRARCFDESGFKKTLRLRRHVLHPPSFSATSTTTTATPSAGLSTNLSTSISSFALDAASRSPVLPVAAAAPSGHRRWLQDMANWDPVFPGERVSWYDEYIHRHGHTAVNWMQQPRFVPNNEVALFDTIDVRGVALFRQNVTRPGPVMAVAPLDDGSVCLWDANGARGDRGAIVGRSAPGMLLVDGPSAAHSQRSKRVDTGVAECISVSHQLGLAFVAVQSHLITIDLNRLDVVDYHPFPSSITGLSAADPGVPLTVATSGGVCLVDYRSRLNLASDMDERVTGISVKPNPYSIIFDKNPLPPIASTQPGAISIVHLPRPGCPDVMTDHLYVGGRFASIAHFDRRVFPKMVDSLYSGARLSSLACLPFSFSAPAIEKRKRAELTADEVERSKTRKAGCTLVAAGDYHTKGSLELYGIAESGTEDPRRAVALDTDYKNRQTAAASRLLSVAAHGTRLMCSDGMGNIKWFERDGSTKVRQVHIGHCEQQRQSSLFAGMPGSDDIARKIISTQSGLQLSDDAATHNDDDVLFWTGDRLGMVTFSRERGFTTDDFEEVQGRGVDAARLQHQEMAREYQDRMRQALEMHADEARFAQTLGIGAAGGASA